MMMADLRRDLGEDGGAAEFGEALGFAAADADGQAGADEEESGGGGHQPRRRGARTPCPLLLR